MIKQDDLNMENYHAIHYSQYKWILDGIIMIFVHSLSI